MRTSLQHCLMTAALLCSSGVWGAQSRPAVVELFTSEGCSSCPPAEAYVGELAARPDVLALAFHVDYWDDLGWRDRFGLPESVQRQRTYAKNLRLASIYTPQIVIDGEYDFVGSDRLSIARSLMRSREGVAVSVSIHAGEILVELPAQERVASSDVILVGYQRSAVSPIGHGENAGHTIKEFNIVREFRSLGTWQGQRRQFQYGSESLPHEVTDVAVLVQPLSQSAIIGAASTPLH